MSCLIEKLKVIPSQIFPVSSTRECSNYQESKPVGTSNVEANVGLERGERDLGESKPYAIIRF